MYKSRDTLWIYGRSSLKDIYSLTNFGCQNYHKIGLFYGHGDIPPGKAGFFARLCYNTEKEAIVVIREKIIAWLRDEQKKLAPMSPKKKWEYIWNYMPIS